MKGLIEIILKQLRRVLPEKVQIGIGVTLVGALGIVSALGAGGVLSPELVESIMKWQQTILYVAGAFGASGGTIMINEQVETNRQLARSMDECARSMNEVARKFNG